MARRIASTSSPEWIALFTGFARSAFRLETLQHYTAADEADAFARFRAGQDPEVDLSWWLGLVAGHHAAGRSMVRVRVVIEPPTDYTRFELAHFPMMVDAGDDIRIIATTEDTWPAALPRHDFWIFDDDVWFLEYDDAGVFLGAEALVDPGAIAEHMRWRETAMAHAIPVYDYLASATARRRAS